MKRGVSLKKKSPMSRPMSPMAANISGDQSPAQVNLADKLIETIRNLTSNRDLLSTRISLLNGDGLKTASIMEVAGMYRSLVSQVAVLYDTADFQDIVAPYIENRFVEIGSPSLIPGTIGSYIFGCYLSDYGAESPNRFCTPICAASIRVPNRNRINMRCTEKVIWTDGGDTPIFVLIDEDPTNSQNGKVFIPWVGDASSFSGLTQGAIDEIKSLGVENIEIYGQLFNNKYILLMSRKSLSDVAVVARIRIRAVEYVNSKNGGSAANKINKVDLPKVDDKPVERQEEKPQPVQNTTDKPIDTKITPSTNSTIFILIGVAIAVTLVILKLTKRIL